MRTCNYPHCDNSLDNKRKQAKFCSRYCKERNRAHDCSNWRSHCNPNIGIEGALERNRRIIAEAKDKPCADCGLRYPTHAMDLDHLPGSEKLFELSDGKAFSEARIRAEIEKCEAVCANCHRIRTHTRRKLQNPLLPGEVH